MTISKFLSFKQVADILNTSEATLSLWRCLNRHEIPYFKIGSKVLYAKEDLQKWLPKHCVDFNSGKGE